MVLKPLLFTQIKDDKFKPLGVLNLPHLEDDGFYESEAQFLNPFRASHTFMLIVAFGLAYFLATYITKSKRFQTDKRNQFEPKK
jgi:hypothetical protein